MMYTAKIKIQPESYLLCASGEGRANINAEFLFDSYGFPYFSGRRLKGLLRESMIEVLEIMGNNQTKIEENILKFFGTEGSARNEGLLTFDNLRLPNWFESVKYLRQTKNAQIKPSDVRNFYMVTVQQTSIEQKTGVAKDKSLRTYHVLNYINASAFEGELASIRNLDTEETNLLKKTCLHFRYAGTRRNRGFGNLKCTLSAFTQVQPLVLGTIPSSNSVKVDITCLQNVVLSTVKGEENTIYSEDYVSGNRLRGVLAGLYIKEYGVDNDFKTLFIRQNLNYKNCYCSGARPLPDCIQRNKYMVKRTPINTLGEDDGGLAKRIGGFINSVEKVKIAKDYQFHNSRPNRAAGRSVEGQDAGGIFYYESISAGESFEGNISGEPKYIKLLINKLGTQNVTFIGKSKSAQYGKVQLTFLEDNNIEINENSEASILYAVAQSPIIILNEFGHPSPNQKTLDKYLPGLEIESATTQITTIEQFNTQWLSKSGKMFAYKEGSCFKIKSMPDLPESIGEWQDQGFGQLEYFTEVEINDQMEIVKEKSTIIEGSENNSLSESEIPQLVQMIMDNQEMLDVEIEISIKGIEDSKSLKRVKISNSLIGRMNGILDFDENNIKTFLNDIGKKEAGKTLDRFLLLDQLKQTSNLEGKYTNFKEYQIYWKSFFNSLRLRNKLQSN